MQPLTLNGQFQPISLLSRVRNYRLYKIRTAPLSERSSIENYYSKIIAGVLKNEKHLPKPEHIPANFIVLFNLLNRYHQYCLLYHQDKGKLRKS